MSKKISQLDISYGKVVAELRLNLRQCRQEDKVNDEKIAALEITVKEQKEQIERKSAFIASLYEQIQVLYEGCAGCVGKVESAI